MPPKKRTGRKLLAFDRKLGGRFVAGADEAGRGPLAGPLVVAGVLLDYECLRDHRVRPLALLNDSKQVDSDDARGALPRGARVRRARLGARLPAGGDRPRRPAQVATCAACARRSGRASRPTSRLVDGFKLGPTAPPHRAVVDGDDEERRDRGRLDRREGDARPLHAHAPTRSIPAYGFASHVGYITPSHSARRARAIGPVRDPPPLVPGACYLREPTSSSPRPKPRNAAERRAARWYRLRGYRVLDTNAGSPATSSTSSRAAGGRSSSAR